MLLTLIVVMAEKGISGKSRVADAPKKLATSMSDTLTTYLQQALTKTSAYIKVHRLNCVNVYN